MKICATIKHERAEKKKLRDREYRKFSRKVRNFGDPILYTFAKGSTRRTSTPKEEGLYRVPGDAPSPPAEHANAIIYYLVIVYRRRYARTLQLFSIVLAGVAGWGGVPLPVLLA